MMIYNLVFICAITIIGFLNLLKGITDDDLGSSFWACVIFVTGVIAIIFQSINL